MRILFAVLLLFFSLQICQAQYLGGVGQGETSQQIDAKILDGTAGGATTLNFSVSPPNVFANQRFSVIVDVLGSNNLRINSSASISMGIGSNPSSGVLNGILAGTAVNGRMVFLGLAIDKAGNGYTVQATSTGINASSSQSFEVYGNIYGGGSGDGFDENQNLNAVIGGQKLWRGATSTDWATAANWYPSGVPTSTDAISIENNAYTNNPVLDGNRTIASVDFGGASKKIEVGAFTLTVSAEMFNADANNFVKTASTGVLKRSIANAASFTFPVGNTAYNPVIITNNTTAADVFSVRVMDEVYWKGTSGGITTTPRVKRTWIINKNIPNSFDGNGVDFSFAWNTGEATAGLNTPRLYHFDGSQWQKQAAGNTVNSTNNLLYNGYKGTFSPFSIGDDVVLLPVTWLDFRCEAAKDNTTRLHWRTAMEQNTRAFIVERSADGQAYQSIGEVPATGHSQTLRSYAFADPQPMASGGYYRVRMEDREGNFSYSDVCNSKAGAVNNPAPLKVFPNPTDGGLYMIALEPERNFVWEVFSATGQRVASGNSQDGQANARLHHLSEGLYQLRVIGTGLSENHRILIRH